MEATLTPAPLIFKLFMIASLGFFAYTLAFTTYGTVDFQVWSYYGLMALLLGLRYKDDQERKTLNRKTN